MLHYRLIDADNHYYETDDAYTRLIDPRFRDRAVNIRRKSDGLGKIYIGDQRLAFMSVTPMDYVQPPGSMRPFLEGKVDRAGLVQEVLTCPPEFQKREARLDLMESQRIEAMILFPTMGVVVEHELHDDVDVLYANLIAFNRWLDEDWGFDHVDQRGRIISAPMISLVDIDRAIAETDRVLAAGARLVHVKPGPVYGRSPADPIFDGFWARVAEAGVPVAFHAGDTGYNELISAHWGEPARTPSRLMSSLQFFLGHHRPIMDTLAALTLHDLFGRFPDLQVMSIEQGSEWVPELLSEMDKAHRFHGRDWTSDGRPSDVFKRHVWVAPFHEEDVSLVIDALGPEHVLFGSDFPHPEGVADPADFAEVLRGLDAADVRKIMRDNTAGLLRL